MEKSEMIKNGVVYKKSTILFIILLIFTIIGGYISSSSSKESMEEETNTTSSTQSFLFTTIKGQQFQINATSKNLKIPKMSDRVVFLKVFGWECKYCQKEIPELIKLKEQFDGAFDIIAIESQGNSREINQKIAKNKGINYHVVTGTGQERFLNYLKEHHGWSGVIPLSIVIGEDGKILAFEVGAKSYTLAELLKVSLQQYKLLQELENKE
jgi:thiol-disulfide isomerase/thioredoxin